MIIKKIRINCALRDLLDYWPNNAIFLSFSSVVVKHGHNYEGLLSE